MKPTSHSKQRAYERTELSTPELKQKTKQAYKSGIRLHALTGELYEYIRARQIDDGGHFVVRVFENNVYIFDARRQKLMTIYPVPEELLPIENYLSNSGSPCLIFLTSPNNEKTYVAEDCSFTDDIGLAIEFRTTQKATNYIKNNKNISILLKQGYTVDILPL